MWSNKNGEPLRQMYARSENMYDVREKLGHEESAMED